ncbi:vera protein [Xylariomycetidae sp. FL0641]|nr:vera protein [Xylariomycetidae sp. FL0641]
MAIEVSSPLLLRALGVVVLLVLARGLHQGYKHRSRVRGFKAQGIPVLPHSLLWGHLRIFSDFRNDHPPDVNIYVFHTWLMANCQKYFPGLDFPPPVVYLDLWPVIDSMCIVFDPVSAAQFTQVKSLPKVQMVRDYLEPLTGNIDIVSNEGQTWKTWRSRFNPGFSQRNIGAMLPEIIEEANVFVDVLRKLSGKDGSWGRVFQYEQKTTNLTFDIMLRAALDMRLHEQTNEKSSPLKTAMMDQIALCGKSANAARALPIGRMPWDRAAIARNNKTIRAALMPEVQKRFAAGRADDLQRQQQQQKKTIINLAVQYASQDEPLPATKSSSSAAAASSDNGTSDSDSDPSPEFTERLIANLKAFIFAGHDTTATTLCFMAKLLADHPACLAALRAEHDAVLGPDPGDAAARLAAAPHLLYALPYTLGVIKETLRLYPLAATMREAPPGFCLTSPADDDDDANQRQQRYPVHGFAAWQSAPGIQRHPGYWARAGEFLPERWTVPEDHPLGGPARGGGGAGRDKAFVAFSLGPRSCIGVELALMELRLVAVLVARQFDIEEAWEEWDRERGAEATPDHVVEGQRLYQVGGGTVHPKDGMPVRVRMRDHVAVA